MRVLFVCLANSCRSQMAETWARHLFPAGWEVQSAGIITHPIGRRTRAIMAEVGLDMAGQRTKSIDAIDLDAVDLVVTLSEDASRYLPPLAARSRHWHRPVPDPMSAEGHPEEVRSAFRQGRDRVRRIVDEVIAAPPPDSPSAI
jgi:arsenate reductase